MTNKKMMNSGYQRLPDDDYKTIDPRCTYAFLEVFRPMGNIVDVCAPSGSGIVDTCRALGFSAIGIANPWADFRADWVVTNPPYKPQELVNGIVWRQIERVMCGEIQGFASLHRWQFDHALTRQKFFKKNVFYYGQIKTMFRPKWVTDEQVEAEGRKKHQPFHPFIWHIWTYENYGSPVIHYSDGSKPELNK